MPLGILFWIVFLLWVFLGFWGHRAEVQGGNYYPAGGAALVTLMLFLLGWHSFGFIIR